MLGAYKVETRDDLLLIQLGRPMRNTANSRARDQYVILVEVHLRRAQGALIVEARCLSPADEALTALQILMRRSMDEFDGHLLSTGFEAGDALQTERAMSSQQQIDGCGAPEGGTSTEVQPTPGETLSTEVTSSAQAVADRIAAIPRKVDRRAVELWREGYTNVQIAAKLSQEGMPGYGKRWATRRICQLRETHGEDLVPRR